VSPLTHHDILRLARPLVEHGWRIDLAACSRERRRIVCLPAVPHAASPSGVMVLDAVDDDTVELMRAAAWPCPGHPRADGVTSLSARVAVDDLAALVHAMDGMPDTVRATLGTHALLVLDQVLLPDRPVGRGHADTARLFTRSLRLLCPPLVLDIDASPSAGAPADVRLWHVDAPPPSSRDVLASGAAHPDTTAAARIARQVQQRASAGPGETVRERSEPDAIAARELLHRLPDDLLATLGVHWRVLRWQGGYWKGALALPRRTRSAALASAGQEALAGFQDLAASAHDWHRRHRNARRRVFVRRLKPLMVLAAILAVMPVAWLATSRGGVELHPLLLGISPLLMVGMIALSAREIPVMEWPPRPGPLPEDALRALSSGHDGHPSDPARSVSGT